MRIALRIDDGSDRHRLTPAESPAEADGELRAVGAVGCRANVAVELRLCELDLACGIPDAQGLIIARRDKPVLHWAHREPPRLAVEVRLREQTSRSITDFVYLALVGPDQHGRPSR